MSASITSDVDSKEPTNTSSPLPSAPLPRLSRAFSMPLPSQLGHLRRPIPIRSSAHATDSKSSQLPANHEEVANELAESAQMVIQTLLQLSPPHILDPAKEQFSSCELQIPTPSISALLTSMKTLNYMSKHMATILSPSAMPEGIGTPTNDNFDIGEMLQSVGDVLSGVAAEAGVDIVLFHGEGSMKHIVAQGDECGLAFVLSHIVRQIIAVAMEGDVVELGLYILGRNDLSGETMPSSSEAAASIVPTKDLKCTFEIMHRYSSKATNEESNRRQLPNLQSVTLQRLLKYVDAELLETNTAPEYLHSSYQLVARLKRGKFPIETLISDDEEAIRQPYPTLRLAREPTLQELLQFSEKLRARKVVFYAKSTSPFAYHLTSYLTAWGMDVSHVPIDGVLESSQDVIPNNGASNETNTQSLPNGRVDWATHKDNAKLRLSEISPISEFPHLVIIDDDVSILRTRLSELCTPKPSLDTSLYQQRPLYSRANSSPISKPEGASFASPGRNMITSIAIIHFTSLTSYRSVKDAIQYISPSLFGHLPEIVIIPKPAGPRRFLTALHTAVTKPIVDPLFFSPIATSPFRFEIPSPIQSSSLSKNATIPSSSLSITPEFKTALDIDPPAVSQQPPTSPSATEDLEYFPKESSQFAGSSASGLFVQSPDGQTGVFFQPQRHPRAQPAKAPGREGRVQHSATTETQGGYAWTSTPLSEHHISNPTDPKTFVIQLPESSGDSSANPDVKHGFNSEQNGTAQPRSPVSDARQASATKKSNDIVPPISVLIVEDNPIERTVLSAFMKRKRIKYGVASNGQEAVEKWKDGSYHLVLMDIQMPVMNGIEATKEIRKLEELHHMALLTRTPSSEGMKTPTSTVSTKSRSATTPFHSSVIIVALTSSTLESDRVAALAAGCNDFLNKPVALLWLEKKIIEWGSIKALQMWAEPELTPAIKERLAASTQAVADNLRIVRPASKYREEKVIKQPSGQLGTVIPDNPQSDISASK